MKVKIKLVSVLIFFSLNMIYSQTAEVLNYDHLKEGFGHYLIEKEYLKNIEEYRRIEKNYEISGAFNQISNKDSIGEGIYKIWSGGNHTNPFYIIVEGNDYKFLNIYAKDDLVISLNEIVKFSKRKAYCKEVVKSYIKQILQWDSRLQVKRKFDCNLNYELERPSSGLTAIDIKFKIISFLTQEKIIKEDDVFLFWIEKVDEFRLDKNMEYLDEQDEKMIFSQGYYSFTIVNLNTDYVTEYYFLLGDQEIELVSMNGGEALSQEFQSLLNFGLKQKYCVEKVNYILDEYIDHHWSVESCLKQIQKELP